MITQSLQCWQYKAYIRDTKNRQKRVTSGEDPGPLVFLSCNTLRKVQKILLYALKSENTFQSFNMEVYEKIFF